MVILTLLHSQDNTPLQQWRFEDAVIKVGRSPENQLVLHDSVVSRFHLELSRMDASATASAEPEPERWQLVNHSVNGTFVDGEAISTAVLASPTQLQLAYDGPILKFEIVDRPSNTSLGPTEQSSSQMRADAIAPTRCSHGGNPSGNLFCVYCGQPIQVEKTVRQYQVLRVLGRGGMGTTYLVWNPSDDAASRSSALAHGSLQVLKEMNADVAQIPKAQELFEREATTLRELDHPGIPTYYDFFLEEDKKYLVMELVHGRDLEKKVRQTGPTTPQQAIAWMVQTCEVLDYLHTLPNPIIHRDIKPGNLLVSNLEERIVVLDFGAVKAVGAPYGTRIGAEGYCAPEQSQGRALTQSDLYSIGPTLIFLLTGKNPLRFIKREGKEYRFDVGAIAEIPDRVKLLIQRVTSLNPSHRFQTAQELISALQSCS
jgi:serine/threonine protein kinase, bacterial